MNLKAETIFGKGQKAEEKVASFSLISTVESIDDGGPLGWKAQRYKLSAIIYWSKKVLSFMIQVVQKII